MAGEGLSLKQRLAGREEVSQADIRKKEQCSGPENSKCGGPEVVLCVPSSFEEQPGGQGTWHGVWSNRRRGVRSEGQWGQTGPVLVGHGRTLAFIPRRAAA